MIYVIFRPIRSLQMSTDSVLSFPIAAPFDVIHRKDSPAYPVGPHSHNGVEIYLTLSPLPDVLLNDKVSAVPAGTLIIIPPFCVHQLYHSSGTLYERYILSLNMHWLDTVFCGQTDFLSYMKQSAAPLLLTPGQDAKTELIRGMTALLSFPKVTSPSALAEFFLLLTKLNETVENLCPAQTLTPPISSAQQRINEIIAYIHDHITENLTVEELAGHFFLHPDYLSRLFKKHTHTTVSHYITLQKIATAQSLLRDGQTVTQVQTALGYSSYAYFFKSFQKSTGMSPSQYGTRYYEKPPSS